MAGPYNRSTYLKMKTLPDFFIRNRRWAEEVKSQDPDFFAKLSKQQSPNYLWIGCSDSRVPANQIAGLMPGEVFVHRNVGNLVVHTDFNCLAVIQYAVAILKVKHVIVCGHYGCGGVAAALENSNLGLIDNWLRHIRDVHRKYEAPLSEIKDTTTRLNRLCELNVLEQVHNICHSTILQHAWQTGQELSVHGWIYGVDTGLLNDLDVCITKQQEITASYHRATKKLGIL
jgi:carbonic anhydrase